VLRITSPLDVDLRCRLVDLAKIFPSEPDLRGTGVFVEAL
jgi:hypothetical protein